MLSYPFFSLIYNICETKPFKASETKFYARKIHYTALYYSIVGLGIKI